MANKISLLYLLRRATTYVHVSVPLLGMTHISASLNIEMVVD